jgi:TPR repeat protein
MSQRSSIAAMYQSCRGVAQDYGEAMRWYRKAADQGNASAQTNIGWLYENDEPLHVLRAR